MSTRREFDLLFDESELSQRRLALLLGVDKMTVNRWLADPEKRTDAFAPPFYALMFLRVFVMLNAKQRKLVEGLASRHAEAASAD